MRDEIDQQVERQGQQITDEFNAAQSSDRVADALKLWLRFQLLNARASEAMSDFSEFSHVLSGQETKDLARQIKGAGDAD